MELTYKQLVEFVESCDKPMAIFGFGDSWSVEVKEQKEFACFIRDSIKDNKLCVFGNMTREIITPIKTLKIKRWKPGGKSWKYIKKKS